MKRENKVVILTELVPGKAGSREQRAEIYKIDF